MKPIKLPPRTKLYGYDYNKNQMLQMTGKEWHQYCKRETFKHPYDKDSRDTAWSGTGVEVWLDGKKTTGGRGL
jgi:hypothetical protein